MQRSQLWKRVFVAAALVAAGSVAAADKQDWHWVASWGTAQMVPEPQDVLPAELWRDASLRQVVHLSLGGSRLRVRISNAFGTAPLVIDGASVAKGTGGKADVDAASVRPLTFSGRAQVTIPAGAEYYSDPVMLTVAPLSDLAVSLYFKVEPARQTSHPSARATSFIAKGNRVVDAAWPEVAKVERWYQLADVEVMAPRAVGAVVVAGDSITDGFAVKMDANERWPDLLAARLSMGVVNAGIGGGRLLRDGLGPNLASRFGRDVLARSGVTHAIVFIGVNDFGIPHRNGEDTVAGRAKLVEDLKEGHRQLVERAHAQGICVIGATVTPYAGSDYYRPNADNESDRQAINAWIRASGVYDAVADFDAALRDPAQPQRIRKEFDIDGLHPSPAGLRAIADAVPLKALKSCAYR